jgi:hypothetical protein
VQLLGTGAGVITTWGLVQGIALPWSESHNFNVRHAHFTYSVTSNRSGKIWLKEQLLWSLNSLNLGLKIVCSLIESYYMVWPYDYARAAICFTKVIEQVIMDSLLHAYY